MRMEHKPREEEDLEELLARIAAPKVVEGAHRALLKQELMPHVLRKVSVKPRRRKMLAWVCSLTLLMLAGTVWGVQRVFRAFTVREEVRKMSVTLPDGTQLFFSEIRSATLKSEDASFTEEKAKARYQEIQDMIAEGKVKPTNTIELESGEKRYLYRLMLSDGKEIIWGTPYPLGATGDNGHLEEIAHTLARGKPLRGKLIEVKTFPSGSTAYIYAATMSDGTVVKFASQLPLDVQE